MWQDGQTFELFVPPSQIGYDRSSVHQPSDSDRPLLLVDGHSFGGGPAAINCEADFHVVLAHAGITAAPFIELTDGDVSDDAKREVTERIGRILRTRYPDTSRPTIEDKVRAKQLEALLLDAMIAEHFNAPFSTDAAAASILDWVSGGETRRPLSVAERVGNAYGEWTGLGLPDFAAASWDDIQRVRESPAGIDFRRLIETVVRRVQSTVSADPSDLSALLRKELVSELVAEVVALAPTLKDVAFNAAWAFVPLLGGALAAGSDLRKVMQYRQSWLSLLKWKQPPVD